MKNAVLKYGAQSVFGRVMTPEEIRTMNLVDAVDNAYRSRAQAADFNKWVNDNEIAHELLVWAKKQAKALGYDE